MQPVRQYMRALFIALKLTIRGEKPPSHYSNRYPELTNWIEEGIRLVDQTMATANQQGMDPGARREFTLHIDSRDISMETILAAARHNLAEEYPRLLALQDPYALTVIHAINLNDRYRIMRLHKREELTGTPLQTAIGELRDHLDQIPSNNE